MKAMLRRLQRFHHLIGITERSRRHVHMLASIDGRRTAPLPTMSSLASNLLIPLQHLARHRQSAGYKLRPPSSRLKDRRLSSKRVRQPRFMNISLVRPGSLVMKPWDVMSQTCGDAILLHHRGVPAVAEAKRNCQQLDAADAGKRTSPSPAVQALMGGGGISRPNDSPAPTKLSELLRKAAEKISLPKISQAAKFGKSLRKTVDNDSLLTISLQRCLGS